MSYLNINDLPSCAPSYSMGQRSPCANFARYNNGCESSYATLEDAYPASMAQPGCEATRSYGASVCMPNTYSPALAWNSYSNPMNGNWMASNPSGNWGGNWSAPSSSNWGGNWGAQGSMSSQVSRCGMDGRKKC